MAKKDAKASGNRLVRQQRRLRADGEIRPRDDGQGQGFTDLRRVDLRGEVLQ